MAAGSGSIFVYTNALPLFSLGGTMSFVADAPLSTDPGLSAAAMNSSVSLDLPATASDTFPLALLLSDAGIGSESSTHFPDFVVTGNFGERSVVRNPMPVIPLPAAAPLLGLSLGALLLAGRRRG